MERFKLVSRFQPTGDQPQAIEALVDGLNAGKREQTLMGVTGSGKTFTMANVIARVNRPTLVLAHNKTLAAADEEQPVAQTASVMTLDENTSAFAVDGLQYYSYWYETTFYGCGGEYRQVNTSIPNCLGYALFLNICPDINKVCWPSSHRTEDFSDKFEGAINSYYPCRRIDSYMDMISLDEYRIAVRCPNYLDGIHKYHVIYQLSDGTWAGKDNTDPSQHFGRGNPSISPEMWSGDAYSPSAGTIYFAVRREI